MPVFRDISRTVLRFHCSGLVLLNQNHIRLVMVAVRSRCGHYFFALWFLMVDLYVIGQTIIMVALCNRADHNIFIL